MLRRVYHLHTEWPLNNEVLAIILGGGQGSRLFPLTQLRSKPAVPIGGKYRLIDMPVSNCLHADIRRIFVLTQFNSASLNRHIAQTYRMDCSRAGFVEILAAEQTPDNPNWFQGTADAVRQAARHFRGYDADYYLILAGDHLYRMDYRELVDAHIERRRRHHHRRAARDAGRRDADGHLPLRSRRPDRRVRGEAERASGSAEIGQQHPDGRDVRRRTRPEKPFVASMGIYVFSRDVLLDLLERDRGDGLRPRDHPAALGTLPGAAVSVSRLLGGRRHRRVVLRREHHARPSRARRSSSTIRRGRSSRTRASCPARAWRTAASATRSSSEGCYLDQLRDRAVGHRHPHAHARGHAHHALGAARRRLLRGRRCRAGAGDCPRLGIGRNVVLESVIVDKNARIGDGARLVNEQRRRARRRRRLLHPQRHHHRAEGSASSSRDGGLNRGQRSRSEVRGSDLCRRPLPAPSTSALRPLTVNTPVTPASPSHHPLPTLLLHRLAADAGVERSGGINDDVSTVVVAATDIAMCPPSRGTG